nr:hypothetical protein [Tanacetum cinerariifolium]
VVRKSRSRTLWLSDCRKRSSAIVVSERSGSSCLTSEGSSCLSGGSSSLVSSSRSMVLSSRSRELRIRRGRKVVRDVKMKMKMKKKQSFYVVNSDRLLRRSEAILNVLACIGCASEVRIRQLLGDSPDTSKALRMLLRKKEVRRSGAGGKIDPFIYQGYHQIIEANSYFAAICKKKRKEKTD